MAGKRRQDQLHVLCAVIGCAGRMVKNLTAAPRGRSAPLANHGTVHDEPSTELPTLKNVKEQKRNKNTLISLFDIFSILF